MKTLALMLSLVLVMMISGCGSSASIGIVLSPSGSQNAVAGQALNVTAAVSNDSKTAGVTWSLSGAGTISGQTTTSVTYTAPSPIAANATATLTATSISDNTKSVALMINLQAVSIALTPSGTQTLEQSQSVNVTAAVSGDPSTPVKGVTWSLTGAGTLSGQTTTAVKYTAPASITAASSATITATSVFDTTKTTPLTINLVPLPSVTTASLPAGTVGTAYTTTNLAATGGIAPYTWSVTVGALPGGLTLSSAGAISGTPTAYGTFNFTVQAKDSQNFTATANLGIKVNPAPPVITTTSLPSGVVNSPGYSATLTATGGATPITWSVTAGSLPTGLVLTGATGVISGTPTTAGTSSFTVTVTDSSTPALTASKALSITIIPVLSITTSSLPNGITTTAYNATLASTGGSGAVTWSVTVGTLPNGLQLNASTGAITGIPTTAGTSNFTVQAADSGTPQQKVTKALSITIVQALVINNSSLPNGAVNSIYSAALTSSGGTVPVSWSVSVGSLPAGLALNAATGAITGTPTTASTSTLTIQATDSGTPQQTPTKQYTITIQPVLAITTTSLASGTVGTAYSQTVQTNGGGISPITWSVTLGSLPPGLNLSASTGVISGTPTSATGNPFNFTVRAADAGTPQQTSSKALSISVATAPLSVSTTGLPNGVVGQAYSGATLQSAGGNPPVTWSISSGSLPSWATLNASTGAITGTPNATGPTNFTVKAIDSTTPTAQTATQALSINVVAALSITTTSLPNGTLGSPYSSTVAATGGTTPYTWSWAAQSGSSLPPGLNINSSTGAISGTPNSSGTFNLTVTVKDSTNPQQTASANFTITVTAATLTITTTSLSNGTVNTAYNQQVNFSGGTPPLTWSISAGALPSWATLNSSTGAITGTPNATGTTSFTVKATDSATPTPQTATQALSITINAAPACASGGSESLLSGQYAFVVKGFDNGLGVGETAPEPVLVGGVLTFNGTTNSGLITAGTIDMNSNSGVQTALSVTSGSYGVTSDHRGCMVLTTSAGTQNYRFSLGNISGGVASTGHVIDFDSTGPFTAGLLRKQTASAFGTSSGQITGNYAFGASSGQNTVSCTLINGTNVCGGKFAAVGVFNLSGGSVTGGEVDFNTNGQLDGNSANTNWPATPVSISTGGTYTVSSVNGRGTLSFTPSGASAVGAVIYVVSSSEVLVLGSDSQTSNSAFAGEMLQQSGTPFSANPLSGTYIGYQSGLSSTSGASRATLLLLNVAGTGISGTQLRNDAGTFQSKSLTGITYSVASTGRMTVVGGSNPPIFYLVNSGQAFFLSGDSRVEAGFFQSQSGSPFSNSSASGTYAFGNIDPASSNGSDVSGVATFASPNVNVTQDNNSNGSQTLGGTQSFTYSVDSTGLGLIPSGCSISVTPITCNTAFYVISPTRAVVMDLGSSTPKIQTADK